MKFTEIKPNKIVYWKNIRTFNFPYIIIWILFYAWVTAFIAWWSAYPAAGQLFDSTLRSIIHSIDLISSAVFIFLFQKQWFVIISRFGAVMLAALTVIFLIVPGASLQTVSVIAIGLLLGMVNIGILIPFIFVLNNTEKLYSIVGSYVLINLFELFHYRFTDVILPGKGEKLITFLLLSIVFGATIFFKKSSIEDNGSNSENAKMSIGIYMTLVFNCVLVILCRGIGTALLKLTARAQGDSVFLWFYIGGLTGSLSFLFLYAFSRKAFLWLGNITFSSIAMGLMCNAFVSEVPGLAIVFSVLLGIGSAVGMINMYYLLAVVGKKYNSMRYIRLFVLLIGVCGGVSGIIVGNLVYQINTSALSVIASLISAAFMILFLTSTPWMERLQCYKYLTKDIDGAVIDYEQTGLMLKFNLSKREIEVCKLLLEGYTLRQISAILSIAYSTVNTYCTSIYRKFKINSRTELLLLFKNY